MKLALTLTIALCLSSVGHARFGGDYTFEQLFEMSDLVVVIEHRSTERTDDIGEAKKGGKGLLTTAQIIGTLKGTSASKTIKIRHFLYSRYPKSEPGDCIRFPGLDEKARVVATSKGRTSFFRPPWQYIAFLKRQDDGLYVPTLPQERSADSFRTLVDSEQFEGISTPERATSANDENYEHAKASNPAEQPRSDQPTTQPADKAPAEVQPPIPPSMDAPR